MNTDGFAPASLVELLARRREESGGYAAVSLDGTSRTLSFRELYDEAALGATLILDQGGRVPEHLHSETRVVLTIVDPLSFIIAFFATLTAGLVPVPGPSRIADHPIHERRFKHMVQDSKPALVVTDQEPYRVGALLGDDAPPVITLNRPPASHSVPCPHQPAATAYVQYTSGSTASPKPAVLSHGQVIAQLRQAAHAYEETPDSISVNWVPLYHDMGLVTSILRPLYSGYLSVILDPFDFVRSPSFWPAQLSRWQATHTSSPDFGYALAARKLGQTEGLDLSRLRVARNAGEMVRHKTLRDFSQAFEPVGFSAKAFCPSYGLSEATLTVTSCPVSRPPRLVDVSRSALRTGKVAVPGTATDSLRLVSSGPPLDGTTVLILDATTRPTGDPAEVGEVWVCGPQVTGRPQDAVNGVAGVRTGDFGFLVDGELVLVGRSKERFQIRGVNYYSDEIEDVVAQQDSRFRPGRIAAFLSDAPDREQRLVVLAEVRRDVSPSDREATELTGLIIKAVRRELGLTVSHAVLASRGSLPVTTSGKLRRSACRAMYETEPDTSYAHPADRGTLPFPGT
jgi:acyl-CoA synthetase (AMP-forming)/AMP-acid ligase II